MDNFGANFADILDKNKIMKIGILGGSFNPVHQGHVYIANLAIKKLGLNQLWMIPTAKNPLKSDDGLKPYAQRLKACEEILKNHPKIRVKNFEKDSFFSYDLIKKLRVKHPKVQFVWIMGADNMYKFFEWKRVKLLVKLIDFAVFSRGENFIKMRQTKSFSLCHKSLPVKAKGAQFKDSQFRASQFKGGANKKFQFFNTKNYDISSSAIRNANANNS